MVKRILQFIIKYPVLSIAAGFILLMPIVYMITPQTIFSPEENRYLATRPAFTLQSVASGDYMTSFDNYAKEQIPARNVFITLKALSQLLQGKCENNDIARGEDGYLFAKEYKLSEQFDKNIAAIINFANLADRDIYLALVPTAVSIYEDKIPFMMPRLDERAAMTKVVDMTKASKNLHVVDAYPELMKGRDDYLYYRTDHHWTTKGAYIAYQVIAESLNIEPVDLKSYGQKSVNDFYGTSYAKYKGKFIEADTIEYYDIPIESLLVGDVKYDSLYDLDKLQQYDKYAMFMHGNEGIMHVITGNNENDKTLVIFKDSYANCMIPFLTGNYSDIIVVDLRFYGQQVTELMNEYSEADVLLLYNFSFMNSDNHFYKLCK